MNRPVPSWERKDDWQPTEVQRWAMLLAGIISSPLWFPLWLAYILGLSLYAIAMD